MWATFNNIFSQHKACLLNITVHVCNWNMMIVVLKVPILKWLFFCCQLLLIKIITVSCLNNIKQLNSSENPGEYEHIVLYMSQWHSWAQLTAKEWLNFFFLNQYKVTQQLHCGNKFPWLLSHFSLSLGMFGQTFQGLPLTLQWKYGSSLNCTVILLLLLLYYILILIHIFVSFQGTQLTADDKFWW